MDQDSSTSTESSDGENELSREQRFFFTNDFFDIRNHIGDNGLLISGIDELDLSANDVVVKINKKDIRGLLEGDIRKLINASHGAFNQIEFLKHPHFDRNTLDPNVSRVWCYHILQFSKEKKCELPLTN